MLHKYAFGSTIVYQCCIDLLFTALKILIVNKQIKVEYLAQTIIFPLHI